MGTIVGTALVARLRFRLLDPTGVYWSDAELLAEINSAQRMIVVRKPESNTAKAAMQMTAGTEQTIPTGYETFIRFLRNTGPGGTTQDRAPRYVDMDEMNRTYPDWHATDPAGLAENYMHDQRDPRRFYVWPPQPDPAFYCEIICSKLPTDLAALTDTIAISDLYEEPIYCYVLSQAYANNTKRGDTAKSSHYASMFFGILGIKDQTDARETAAVGK